MTALPYLPAGRHIHYVPFSNPYMRKAKIMAMEFSQDPKHPTGAILVRKGMIIGTGANGSSYHEANGCERKKQNIPTGEEYELCEGCHPKNHAEQKAISEAKNEGYVTNGSDMYLWGHWWCCVSCWEKMIDAGVTNVYLLEGAEDQFRRS